MQQRAPTVPHGTACGTPAKASGHLVLGGDLA